MQNAKLKIKRIFILFLTISLLILTTAYAQAAVKTDEKATPPQGKSEVVHAQAYAHYLMGAIYDRRGEFEEAIKEYREALQFAPHSPAIITPLIKDYLWLGRLYRRQGNLKGAIKKYKSLLEFHSGARSKNLPLRFFLAAIYEKEGKLKEAGAEWKKIIELNPNALEAYLQLGRVYLQRNLSGKGIKILEKGRELALRGAGLYLLPRSISGDYRKEVRQGIYFLLGLAYSEKGDYDKAVSRYREYLSLDPNNALVHFYLGAGLDKQGKTKEAVSELKKAIKLNPDNAEALNYLGYLYAEQGIKLKESIELLKKALKLKPDSGYIVDSLGWAYFKQGRLDKALSELKRAVKLSAGRKEDDAIIREHLGDAYFKKGIVKSALRQWEKSLQLNPDNSKLREKIKKAKLTAKTRN